jgi:hypothetical protein
MFPDKKLAGYSSWEAAMAGRQDVKAITTMIWLKRRMSSIVHLDGVNYADGATC